MILKICLNHRDLISSHKWAPSTTTSHQYISTSYLKMFYGYCPTILWCQTKYVEGVLRVDFFRVLPPRLVKFSRRFTLSFPKDKKPCSFRGANIYIHQQRMQTNRVTSSATYFFLRFSFDDKPFHLKLFTGEKIYLSSLHFIHKSCWKIIQLFVEILTVNRS